MESSNLYHHHQLQEQCFGYGLSSSLLDWNPSVSIDEEDDEYYKRHYLDGRLMFPVLSQSAADAIPAAIQQQYYHHQPPSNYVELQHENYSEQTGIISMSSSSSHCNNNITPVNSDYVVKHDQHNYSFDLNQNVFLGGRRHFSAARFGSMNNNNSSNSPPPPSLVSSISAVYTTSYFGFGNIHEAINSPSSSSNKVSKAKRVSGAAMASHHQQQSKKPRTGSQRSSCSVLKVRKEKLGDRIAALHRLVAPFGKTDTASVLTEAIGYIQFLHDQIQALSLPYMKSSGAGSHHPHRTSRVVQAPNMKNEEGKTTLDLKSRGLCLVPLSLTSYISSCQGIYMATYN